ncbi:MAG: endopeptidase La, partial [Clostridium sp. SCN 57-10]
MAQNKNEVIKTYHIPTLALRGVTLFPQTLFHFDVGRQKSVKALEQAMTSRQRIFLVTQKDSKVETPGIQDLYHVGTVAKVRQILKISNENLRVLVEGERRAILDEIVSDKPFLTANISELPSPPMECRTKRDLALLRNVQELFVEYTELAPKMTGDILLNVMESRDMAFVSDYIAQNIQLRAEDRQELLEQVDPRRRMLLLSRVLMQEIEVLGLEIGIHNKVKEQIEKNQKDYYLREQMKAISEELGDGEDGQSESRQYLAKIEAAKLPPEVSEKLRREATRLAKMQSSSPESGVVRTYLDTCLELPWTKTSKENTDIAKAEQILNADHFGIEKVKSRILEFFAVKELTGGVKGQIICLVGPPGVGKTSVARSIARAMGRDYARLSLGGVRDEADIRGHRRTYIGSMPGRIITALKQAGSRNCLILIDEIDKLGSDFKGDPSSALLEVFDTEQNVAFRDHFIELPFDLSDVLFITTANTLDTIPAPLRDRMEIIELGSYTDEEKLQIVKKHMLPKQLKKHGLKPAALRLSDDVLREVIARYTRESGVRSLERQLARLCRKAAKHIVATGESSLKVTKQNLAEHLGVPRHQLEKMPADAEVGVVNGLAWTSVGGELLEVEAMAVPGTGKIELTGNLGDVMRESAKAAMTYIRSRAEALGIEEEFYRTRDVHVHFPEGAVPKDGPSAGITAATALVSVLTGKPVSRLFAMTGEITLRGRVLPIGGLKEKTMAAMRAG